jgi:hypothetical protein
MEMWWRVIVVEHGDDDAKEPADFRHPPAPWSPQFGGVPMR